MPQGRARRAGTTAWLVSLALALTGCVAQRDGAGPRSPTPSATSSAPSSAPSSASAVIDADWSRLAGHGYVYFHARTDDEKHYELFRADLASGDLAQVTDLSGPFGVSNF